METTSEPAEGRSEAQPEAPSALKELQRAVRYDDVAAATRLLAGDPALAQAPSTRGGSLLLEAFEREAQGIAALMVAARDDRGITELDIHEACAMGRAGIVQKRLTDDPLVFEEVGPAGFFPLHRAAYRGHVDAVSLLLQMGADPNIRSENGAALTPLHSVVAGADRYGGDSDPAAQTFLATAERLVAAGADATLEMEGDWTPVTAAEQRGQAELLAALRSKVDGPAVEPAAGPAAGPAEKPADGGQE